MVWVTQKRGDLNDAYRLCSVVGSRAQHRSAQKVVCVRDRPWSCSLLFARFAAGCSVRQRTRKQCYKTMPFSVMFCNGNLSVIVNFKHFEDSCPFKLFSGVPIIRWIFLLQYFQQILCQTECLAYIFKLKTFLQTLVIVRVCEVCLYLRFCKSLHHDSKETGKL
jgi:hypothetical protein